MRFFTLRSCILVSFFLILTGCGSANGPLLETANYEGASPLYLIGPGDSITVFVWGNGELSSTVPVRPDGRITTPLVEDVLASGKTASQLAREMERELAKYIKNPVVTVIVTGFVGRFSEQIRVVGQATNPRSIPYSEHMTLLDVIIQVGGLTALAAGNDASLIRVVDGQHKSFGVRLDELVNEGNINANVDMLPGDVLIIPEAWF